MIKWIKKGIKGLFSLYSFYCEAEVKRLEWYRNEIIKALNKKDYQRASFLLEEALRKCTVILKI